MVARRVKVARERVAWVRYVLEAQDGLGLMHGDGSGTIVLLAPTTQARSLDELIGDLARSGDLEPLAAERT